MKQPPVRHLSIRHAFARKTMPVCDNPNFLEVIGFSSGIQGSPIGGSVAPPFPMARPPVGITRSQKPTVF
jgi:hypothetical protein